ncbi:fluoride efflux transporter CrcB [Ferruginivarius sediminum]|uniref:Fluoride-specific ion channel FluC n=2 Tax=Ferruginivarius sediminum TaxID=2661937 RepID=A0A369T4S2_9PROT|nr:fluoride efflux transporter CrcB [Ferruginivarius sediminum]
MLFAAMGGAAGAAARYGIYVLTAHTLGSGYPFATLFVNVSGSFLLGALSETLALVWSAPEAVRFVLVVGFLGAFTTFSTFSLDFVVLLERGRFWAAMGYAGISVTLSIAALFGGLHLVRWANPATL